MKDQLKKVLMIDHATRYCVSFDVACKKKELIVKKILQYWM